MRHYLATDVTGAVHQIEALDMYDAGWQMAGKPQIVKIKEYVVVDRLGEEGVFYDDDDTPEAERNCPGHSWVYSGTAYGGDDESYHGEGRCYCEHCGADGDA